MLHQEKSEGRAAARVLRATGKAAAGYTRDSGRRAIDEPATEDATARAIAKISIQERKDIM